MAEKQRDWKGDTYGNHWMHRSLIGILKNVDARFIYAFVAIFVVPVCMVVSPGSRVMYRFFRHNRGYSAIKSLKSLYKNNFIFGQIVVDRFAMYAGRHFNIELEGYKHFEELSHHKEGFIQMSAHIGNYELAGYSLVVKDKLMNALVFNGEKESVTHGREKMFAGTNIRMIPIMQDMSHLFAIDKALQNGEILSIPADRLLSSKKTITQQFLGADADFPQGPFSIATMRGLEVLAVNVMKVSLRKYKIYVTPLKYDKSLSRKEQMSQLSRAYVDELQRIVEKYPEQWFNYYDFWKK